MGQAANQIPMQEEQKTDEAYKFPPRGGEGGRGRRAGYQLSLRGEQKRDVAYKPPPRMGQAANQIPMQEEQKTDEAYKFPPRGGEGGRGRRAGYQLSPRGEQM